MKNVLLIVNGASPLALTETLLAPHQQGNPIPDEVFVRILKPT